MPEPILQQILALRARREARPRQGPYFYIVELGSVPGPTFWGIILDRVSVQADLDLCAPVGASTILIAMNEVMILEKQRARQGLAIYFAALLLGSGYFEWRIVQTGESIEKAP